MIYVSSYHSNLECGKNFQPVDLDLPILDKNCTLYLSFVHLFPHKLHVLYLCTEIFFPS